MQHYICKQTALTNYVQPDCMCATRPHMTRSSDTLDSCEQQLGASLPDLAR